jgi:hypothetical protein
MSQAVAILKGLQKVSAQFFGIIIGICNAA